MSLSDQQLLELLAAAPDPTVVVDASGEIVFASTQVKSVFGYDPSELIGSQVEVLLPERFQSSHPKRRDSFFASAKPRPMGIGLKLYGEHKDGSEFPIEISLSPVATDQETLVSSTIRDATVHHDTEKSLAGILETSLNEIYIFDVQSLHFIQVNQGARNNLGYSMDELRSLTPLDLKPMYDLATFQQLIEPLRSGKQDKIEFTTLHERKNGSRYPVEVHLQWMQYGATPVFVAIILDITERKRSEDALRDSYEQLELRVKQRTTALSEATKEAEQANTGKSRFLAAASHDLRQPLQSLGLYLSVLSRQLDHPKHQEIGEKMRNSLNTMGELLDALLDISKLDAGSITAEKRDFNVQPLLDHIVTANYQQAKQKGLTLEITGSSECRVHSDPVLLERVLENFVTNAIRYTEQGSVVIECRCSVKQARISVTDTGIGIPQDQLERVFEEYYQLDNPVRNRHKGLGLGLSIVKHIAQLLEHRLDVSSVPGKGSTFSVEVPLAETGARVDETVATSSNSARVREQVVLFIDDDPAIVDATTMLFELAGVEVYSAQSGDEALAHITAGVRPDIVVSDYRLPGLTGVEVIRKARLATTQDLPAILMTGDTSGQEIDENQLSNCTVLHKPVDTDVLLSLIEQMTV